MESQLYKLNQNRNFFPSDLVMLTVTFGFIMLMYKKRSASKTVRVTIIMKLKEAAGTEVTVELD